MAKINIPPTRSNLLRMKQELRFAREGYEILNRKREVLTGELIRVAHEAEQLQVQMWVLLEAAYRAMEQAQLQRGRALAAKETLDVQLRFRGIMGVAVPVVEATTRQQEMLYSLGDTSASLDETALAFRKVVEMIPELSRLVTTVWRLAIELRKTQRRVNALQYIFIPEYEETVEFIVSSLEERDREETFRLKLLKTRAARGEEPEEGPPMHEYEQSYHDVLGGGFGSGTIGFE
jgi:V/A-type H+-transporting ATPase subunit D